MMNWVKRMLVKDAERDWSTFGFICAGVVVCMFLLFATPKCEKREPEPGRTQVGSHTIVDVEAVLEFEARELEKGK